ncbi:hypothetical protein Tco_1042310 [Tanacetum coccineum]|uniref:Uncharacterized protein n=1 Tax=Tanacetum coccineum TaxID=301880 RepID=A0ABQ5GJY5_9ASTR
MDLLEHQLNKEIPCETVCKTILTKLITTFENAFKTEFKERIQKYTRFDAQSFKDSLICDMDSIGKYMLEIILHQQQSQQLLNQKKLLQTQEDQSNTVQALNVDILKVDSIVIQNTCSGKQDSNLETAFNKQVKECSLNSEIIDFVAERTHHQRQYDRRVNKRHMQTQESKIDMGKALDADLVVTESSETESEVQDERSRFASQVDVKTNLSKRVTQHYLPKGRKYAFAKPSHMIASSSSKNSSKNMPRFSSNGMVHNHYLEEAKKNTQERDRNSKTSVMPSARFQSTTDGSTPKPMSINQSTRNVPTSKSSCVTITDVPKADHSTNTSSFSDSKYFVCSTCQKCVFNANHDTCITKFLKEVNSRANIQSHKIRNSNKPVDQKSHTQKPGRQIIKGHRFSPNKSSVVYEKSSPRSDLRWKPRVEFSNLLVLELESLFGHFFDEYFNGENLVVSKSFAVTTADVSDTRQPQPDSSSSSSTLATTVSTDGNFDL